MGRASRRDIAAVGVEETCELRVEALSYRPRCFEPTVDLRQPGGHAPRGKQKAAVTGSDCVDSTQLHASSKA